MKKIIIILITILLLITPWLINYFNVSPNLFMELSKEMSLDNYFSNVLSLNPFYSYGLYSFGEYIWFSYISQVYLLGLFFGKASGVIYILLIILIGFFYTYKLILEFYFKDENEYNYIYSLLLSFLIYTSPTIFLYIKGSIALTVAPILFPLQLYFLFKYIKYGFKKYLLIIIFSFLLILYANLTTILLNMIFLLIFSFIYFKKEKLKIIFTLFISSILPLLIIGTILFTGIMLNYSDGNSLLGSVSEDFYSNNNTILNIFKQTADWAFFGGFDGKYYFDFAEFYKNTFIQGVGLFFLLGSIILIGFSKNKSKTKYLILILFIVFLMLGLRNPIYKYLYDNLVGFQIFRNIQKFAPFLLFSVIFSLAVIKNKQNVKYIIILIILGLIYNIPYYKYNDFFISQRSVSEIPNQWKETSKFINDNLNSTDSKILLLPATYINEVYNFDSGEVLVGVFTDHLIETKAVRLSPKLNGDTYTQLAMNNLFISNENTLYGEIPDISKIDEFINKYNYSHILITNDMIVKYEDGKIYEDLFNNKKYSIIYKNEFHTLYEVENKVNKIKIIDGNIVYNKNNYLSYNLNINFDNYGEIIFYEPFHPEWKIYLKNKEGLFNNFLFDNNHIKRYNYANSWDISKQEIISYIDKNYGKELKKEGYPKQLEDGKTDYKYYILNPDGSIDVELTLYFKPQMYFYIGLIISASTFLLLILGLIINSIKDRKNKELISKI